MIGKAIAFVREHNSRIASLKKESKYYPSVLIKEYPSLTPREDKVFYLSTLVRIKRGGKYYVVHCVEDTASSPEEIQRAFLSLIDMVHKTQHLYKLTGRFEELDTNQESEIERLTNLIP